MMRPHRRPREARLCGGVLSLCQPSLGCNTPLLRAKHCGSADNMRRWQAQTRIGPISVEGSMGDCKYCGKPAGFLRSEHAECATAHAKTMEKLPQLFTGYVALAEKPTPTDALRADVNAAAAEGFLSADALKSEVI